MEKREVCNLVGVSFSVAESAHIKLALQLLCLKAVGTGYSAKLM